jgi:hypothetical protein
LPLLALALGAASSFFACILACCIGYRSNDVSNGHGWLFVIGLRQRSSSVIGGSSFVRFFKVVKGHVLTVALYVSSNINKRFRLIQNISLSEISLHVPQKYFIPIQANCRNQSAYILPALTIIEPEA